MERLFAKEVAGQASERQKPAQLCKKIWRVENPEGFKKAKQIKALIKEAKEVLALSTKEYELISRLKATGERSKIEKILDDKWSHLLGVAKQLEDFGYYVFLRAASFNISLLIQMQTYLKQGRDVMSSPVGILLEDFERILAYIWNTITLMIILTVICVHR